MEKSTKGTRKAGLKTTKNERGMKKKTFRAVFSVVRNCGVRK